MVFGIRREVDAANSHLPFRQEQIARPIARQWMRKTLEFVSDAAQLAVESDLRTVSRFGRRKSGIASAVAANPLYGKILLASVSGIAEDMPIHTVIAFRATIARRFHRLGHISRWLPATRSIGRGDNRYPGLRSLRRRRGGRAL